MFNQVILMGKLGRKPVLQKSQDKAVVDLSVVTTTTTKVNGILTENVQFHTVRVWGVLAQSCAGYLHKGSKVHVLGQIEYKSWTTDSGENRTATLINSEAVQFLK